MSKPNLVPKADLEHMASGAPPRAFERGMDPSEVITPLASDCIHYRALLEEIRSMPLLGFVQCAYIDTRQTALPDPTQVMTQLEAWEKRADEALGGE